MEKELIVRIAKFYRSKMKNNDVANLIRFHNIKIENVFDDIEYSLVIKNYKSTAYIKSNLSLDQKNYDLGCIFGRYAIHNGLNEKFNITNVSIENDEAICFANNLLMPEDVFKNAYEKTKGNHMMLMITFNVPDNVIEDRIKELI